MRAETRAEKFLPVRERAIVNAQSLDGAEMLFPIVRPASQSLLAGVSPLHLLCVIFSSYFAGGSSRDSSRDHSKISKFHDIVRLVESISINSAYYW